MVVVGGMCPPAGRRGPNLEPKPVMAVKSVPGLDLGTFVASGMPAVGRGQQTPRVAICSSHSENKVGDIG